MTDLVAMNQKQHSWILRKSTSYSLLFVFLLVIQFLKAKIGVYSPENEKFSGDCRGCIIMSVNNCVRDNIVRDNYVR